MEARGGRMRYFVVLERPLLPYLSLFSNPDDVNDDDDEEEEEET